MAPKRKSKPTKEVQELKKLYARELKNAQARYRRQAKKEHPSIAYTEARKTGGQFSFRNIMRVGRFYRELARIRQFTSMENNSPEDIKLEAQRQRAKLYIDLFAKDISMEQRYALGLDRSIDEKLYRIYRKLEEESPGLINYGGVFSSEEFISYLYNELVDGKTETQVQTRGHNLLEEIKSQNPNFIKHIPYNTLRRYQAHGHYTDYDASQNPMEPRKPRKSKRS